MAESLANHRHILVIDDNEDFADGLSELMEMHEHEVDVVLTGGDGVKAAQRNTYDIIFIDVRLPDMNGTDCANQIRNSAVAAKLLLMTGYIPKDLPAQVEAMENADLLTKPIDPLSILEQIVRITP